MNKKHDILVIFIIFITVIVSTVSCSKNPVLNSREPGSYVSSKISLESIIDDEISDLNSIIDSSSLNSSIITKNTSISNTSRIGVSSMAISISNKDKSEAETGFDINNDVPVNNIFNLPDIADNMVLQRNTVINFKGTCKKNGAMAIIVDGKSWFGECIGGKFEIKAGPFKAGGPYTITIRTEFEKTVISNVLFGDVYLCSGQSNMVMKLGEMKDPQLAIRYANDNVRYLNIDRSISKDPINTYKNVWLVGDELSVINNLSAVGVMYGSILQRKYNIPIGIMISCVGATFIAAWMPEHEAEISEPIPYVSHENYPDYSSEPSYYYNSMIHPLTGMKIKGVVWYQGEGQANQYARLLTNLIKGWRREFQNPFMFFIIIQLPRYDNNLANTFSIVREDQALVARRTINVDYSVNIDLGDIQNIHSFDKEPLAIRTANVAMSLIYKEKGILKGPTFKSFYVEGDSVIIDFDNTGTGLDLVNNGKGFEICGIDGVFYEASPEIKGNEVILKSIKVPAPVNAQYGFANFPEVSLYNNENLPCEPFRTQFYQNFN
ncbi:MAG: sialate O-acetylesterase [Saccharofermentanales bacterium]